MATKKVYLKINEDMKSSLDSLAVKQGVPRASIIKQIITKGLSEDGN
jgi:predicted DNA-binding protein